MIYNEFVDNLASIKLKLPRNTEVSPESTQTFLSSLAGINKTGGLKRIFGGGAKPMALEITLENQEISFQITAHKDILNFIESQIESNYPLVTIQKSKAIDITPSFSVGKLVLKNGNYYPIKTYAEFKDVDPLASVLSVISKNEPSDIVIIQLSLLSLNSKWRMNAENYAKYGTKNVDGTYAPRGDANIIKEKTKVDGFAVTGRIGSNNPNLLSQIGQAFNVFNRTDGNSFGFRSVGGLSKKGFIKKFNLRTPSDNQILNLEEIATLWHLPSDKIKASGIAWEKNVLSEPPANLPIPQDDNSGINFLGKVNFKNHETIFGIKDADRRRHTWVIGKTGTGKSTLIANMAIDDIKKGKGIAVIDPHGDLSETLLDFIPANRINDVIYFNPADRDFPVTINPLEVSNHEEAELVVSGIVSIFNKIFGYSWGPRLEYILRNTLLTLSETDDATMKDIPLILNNRAFRDKVTSKLTDPVLISFWRDEYNKMTPDMQSEANSPILNKVGQFVTSPMIRNIISSPKSTMKIEDIMNQGKILIANLSSGKLGEDNAALLGAMLITKVQLAAMRRVDIPEDARRDFYFYVDEFQNFATTSFIKILSEARKYHLDLMLANQYMAQIPIEVQKAILGNAGTIITFAIGAGDAEVIYKEFAEVFTQNDLTNLAKFETAIKLMVDGYSTRPFLAKTLPLAKSSNQNREKVIRLSRERWAKKMPQ
jgi:hypothetical protein